MNYNLVFQVSLLIALLLSPVAITLLVIEVAKRQKLSASALANDEQERLKALGTFLGDIPEQEQKAEIITKQLATAIKQLQMAQKNVSELKYFGMRGAQIKPLIDETEQVVNRLKQNLASQVQKSTGFLAYPPAPVSTENKKEKGGGNSNGNGAATQLSLKVKGQDQKEDRGARINALAKENNKKFNDVMGLISEMRPDIKKFSDFESLNDKEFDELLKSIKF